MKKNVLKLTAVTLALTFSLGYANSFAKSEDVVAISENVAELKNNQISVSGEIIDGKTITDNNVLMVPVRAISEKLGFSVEWNSEGKIVSLVKSPQYITFQIGVDGYTFAKTAPMPLGHESIIIDSVTYVPVSLFSDILGLDIEINKNNSISINYKENDIQYNAKVSEILEENQLLINDTEKGDVVLNISEFVTLTNSEGKIIEFSDIKVGDEVFVEYGDAMTMSIPPMNNPIQIVVK